MAAVRMQPPRIPQALARHQEALPLIPKRTEPLPQVLGRVISLKAMCCKYWLERVQLLLRRDVSKPHLMALQRYLSDVPVTVRSQIIHNGLRAGGLHLAHGLREVPAVNKALVFLTSDVNINHEVYLTIPKPGPDGMECPLELELLLRYGDGLTKIVATAPPLFSDPVKRLFSDLCRSCKKITHMTLNQATDAAITVLARHLNKLVYLDVSGSEGVTDEGVNRLVVNLKWGESDHPIKHVDVGRTSVTQEGLVNLITRLPTLTCLGSSDVVEALGAMEEVLGGEVSTTKLEETTLKCVTVNRIKTLRKSCPSLKSLTAIFQEPPGGATLNDLKLLPGVVHLKLQVREPFLLSPQQLYDQAWAVGSRLLTLRLGGDVYWEADLALLATHCPNLQELALPAVTFPTKESLQALQVPTTLPLTRLQVLELDCMTGVGPKAWAKDFNLARRGLVVALQRCTRLRRLLMRPMCLVDTDLLDILAVNRLPLLEVLELYNCTLSLATARIMMDTCIELHVLKGLRTWRGITMNDLVLLRKFSRGHRRAAELKVLP